MSDLARWGVRGFVRTLRTHLAEWNSAVNDWSAPRGRTVVTFRPDGQVHETEHHNPDGSVVRQVRTYDPTGALIEDQWWAGEALTHRTVHTYDTHGRPASAKAVDADGTERATEVCRYDDDGRKTKVVTCPVAPNAGGIHHTVEGSEVAYSAPGATSSTTVYDQYERPSEVIFHDAHNAAVGRVVFTRDEEGRAVSERLEFADLGRLLGRAVERNLEADDGTAMAQLLEQAFDDHAFAISTYAYDQRGRRIETTRRIGGLSEERTTVEYDAHGNPLRQVTTEFSREVRMDAGTVTSEAGSTRVQSLRFEYQYDEHGNWTERVVWQRAEPDTDERPSNVERRAIAYYTE